MLWKLVKELEKSFQDDKLTLRTMIATMDCNFGPKSKKPLKDYDYKNSPLEKLALILNHLIDLEEKEGGKWLQ